MRFALSITATFGLFIGFSAFAGPIVAQTTCGDELEAAMRDDPDSAANCEVIVKDGARQVHKRFHAEVVNDLVDGKVVAKIELKEFCDNCKPTLHAIKFREIAQWVAEHASNELDGEPDPETLSNDCMISNDTLPTSADMLQCRVSAMQAKMGSAEDFNQYYGKFIQPRLQRLAVSRNRDLQTLLQQTLAAVARVATQSPVVTESLRQFKVLGKVIDQANTYEQAMLAANAQPQVRVELTRAWKATQSQAISEFSNRSNVLKSQGVTDKWLLGNADALVNVVRLLGFPGGNAPNVPQGQSSPRTMYGTPGIPHQATPTIPSVPPRGMPSKPTPGGLPAGLFHAS
jgi:hypothetical protein